MLILWSWPKPGEFGNVIIGGPLDVSTSCEQASGDIKGIVSPINGQADVLIFPNIESGNAFYKSVSLFAKADMAGLLQGPICPVVLPSRSDSGLSKYYSIAVAVSDSFYPVGRERKMLRMMIIIKLRIWIN